MFKKKSVLFCLLASLLLAVWSQDRLDVTDEGHFLPGSPPQFVAGPAFATWVAYHNGIKISEPEFYRLVGDQVLASNAEIWQAWKGRLGWGGLGVIGTGIVSAVATGLLLGDRAGDLPFYIGAASLSFGGVLWVGYFSLGFNYRPFSDALRMAEDYNTSHK